MCVIKLCSAHNIYRPLLYHDIQVIGVNEIHNVECCYSYRRCYNKNTANGSAAHPTTMKIKNFNNIH